ncbi:PREDICTED: podoplanin [Chaetura pelagica]|uniref:podoplanin n=1 Tax=Chaetura pelagica TaxID=8897 RepID=UPI000523DD76|nr:PREDICTED: podoplanin [Chaetura pelagica]
MTLSDRGLQQLKEYLEYRRLGSCSSRRSKMIVKVQLFIFVLGTMPFIALAEEASSVLEGEESATIDFREKNYTEFEELPTLSLSLPTKLHNVTNLLQFGQLMTTESAFDPLDVSDNSTGYEANTENVDGRLNEEPEKTEKGGLETVALVGIIIGIIVAVGILVGIIIAVVRKMSGRYS